MPKFRVIEGTVWEVTAGDAETARKVYEDYFKGEEYASDAMQEIEGSAYWYGDEEIEGGKNVLNYLSSLYEDIDQTDIWAEYMGGTI